MLKDDTVTVGGRPDYTKILMSAGHKISARAGL